MDYNFFPRYTNCNKFLLDLLPAFPMQNRVYPFSYTFIHLTPSILIPMSHEVSKNKCNSFCPRNQTTTSGFVGEKIYSYKKAPSNKASYKNASRKKNPVRSESGAMKNCMYFCLGRTRAIANGDRSGLILF